MVYELSRPIIYQPCLANIQGWYSKYFSMYLHPTYAHFVFLKFLRYEFKSSNLFFLPKYAISVSFSLTL